MVFGVAYKHEQSHDFHVILSTCIHLACGSIQCAVQSLCFYDTNTLLGPWLKEAVLSVSAMEFFISSVEIQKDPSQLSMHKIPSSNFRRPWSWDASGLSESHLHSKRHDTVVVHTDTSMIVVDSLQYISQILNNYRYTVIYTLEPYQHMI